MASNTPNNTMPRTPEGPPPPTPNTMPGTPETPEMPLPPPPIRAPGRIVISLPFDNVDHYTDIWTNCTAIFTKFSEIGKGKGVDIKLTAAGSNITLSVGGKEIKNNSPLDTAHLLILFRYRDLLEQTSTINFDNISDFFNEIEANREYHARACIALCSINPTKIKSEMLLDLNVNNLDVLDRLLFTENTKNPYETSFLVCQLMVKLAVWENEWLEKRLLKDEYMTAIMDKAVNINLPSHLRVLSRYAGVQDVETARAMYPQSVLMNYSMFYPFNLYPTGKPPLAPVVPVPVVPAPVVPGGPEPGGPEPTGTRKYKDGREVPFWDTNDKGIKLKDNWRRSTSQKVKPNTPFYYKDSGSTTWNNPNEVTDPKLVSTDKKDSIPSSPIAGPKNTTRRPTRPTGPKP